jgi:methyltransferase OMS1, mitochondrial
MSNTALRKAAVLLGGGGVYAISAYYAYRYIQFRNGSGPFNHCPHCGGDNGKNFSFVDNPLRTEQFQKVASCYDSSIGRDEFIMGINLLRRSLLYWHARGTVLEVGAGTARNLAYYPLNNNASGGVDRVLLTDASDQMLQQAQQKLQHLSPEKRPKFAILQADSANLAMIPNDSIDTVVDTFGLCSYQDPQAVLQEMVRVCKKKNNKEHGNGGKILLLEHGRSKTWDWVTRHLDEYAERHAANWGCVWNRDLDALLDNTKGLQVEILRKWHFGTTYYVVCRPQQREQPTTESNVVVVVKDS